MNALCHACDLKTTMALKIYDDRKYLSKHAFRVFFKARPSVRSSSVMRELYAECARAPWFSAGVPKEVITRVAGRTELCFFFFSNFFFLRFFQEFRAHPRTNETRCTIRAFTHTHTRTHISLWHMVPRYVMYVNTVEQSPTCNHMGIYRSITRENGYNKLVRRTSLDL